METKPTGSSATGRALELGSGKDQAKQITSKPDNQKLNQTTTPKPVEDREIGHIMGMPIV